MNQHLEILESKIAHLEITVEELNQVVYEQAKRLDLVQAKIASLQSRFKEMMEDVQSQPHSVEDEIPPHY